MIKTSVVNTLYYYYEDSFLDSRLATKYFILALIFLVVKNTYILKIINL